MKVCLISPYPPQQDGISEYARSLAQELAKRADVVVLAEALGSQKGTDGKEKEVRVLRVSDRGSPTRPLELFRVLREQAPDVVHVQYESYGLYGALDFLTTPLMLLLLKLACKDLFLTVHSFIDSPAARREDFDYKRAGRLGKVIKYAYQVARMTVNLTIRLSRARLVVSTETLRLRVSQVLKLPLDDIMVIPIGFESTGKAMRRSEARRILGIGDQKVALCYGFISAAKNVHHLVDAVRVLSPKHLQLLALISGAPSPFDPGAHSYLQELREMVRGDEKIRLLPRFAGDDETRVLFSAADIAVLTYPGARGGSAVLSLALSYGLPVVVPDGGTAELLVRRSDAGLIYADGDAASLAERILTLLTDRPLAESCAENALRYASARTWDIIASKTVEAYSGTHLRREADKHG